MAVRAVARNIILSRELGDLGHFFYAIVVLEAQVAYAVARRRRHGFLASGAALVLRSVPVRAVIGAGPSSCRVYAAGSGSALRGVTNLRQAHSLCADKKRLRPSTEYCWSCHTRNIKTLAISERWAPSRVRQKAGVWQEL